ncbi:MAG TPA: hypothetical protein VFO65_01655, partial [Acidimicrobiales bacterium]|nr:hypothetical protein [Acidimicrobiales bacterium]
RPAPSFDPVDSLTVRPWPDQIIDTSGVAIRRTAANEALTEHPFVCHDRTDVFIAQADERVRYVGTEVDG